MATTDKYDRQLRLWGASGQRALSSTTIVLINATAAGTETLKNLVLPGVGGIHVVDGEDGDGVPVKGRDATFSNFFVFDEKKDGGDGGAPSGSSSSSSSRAEVACRNLTELNPDVAGSHTTVPSLLTADYGSLLDAVRSSGSDKNNNVLIVASDLPPAPLLSLSAAAHVRHLPLLIVRTCGLIGSVRVQVGRHSVVESKPDSTVPDLRLAVPSGVFPALRTLVDSTDLDSLDDAAHSHVPYVVLLVKALQRWREEAEGGGGGGRGGRSRRGATKRSAPDGDGDGDDGGEDGKDDGASGQQEDAQQQIFPRTPEEKAKFRDTIRTMARNYNDELNFQEAHDDAYLAYSVKDLPWEVTELVEGVSDDSVAESIRTATEAAAGSGTAGVGGVVVGNAKFDVLLLSLKRFLAGNGGHPPLDGRIPDMTASTALYVALQEAYRSRAEEDRAAVGKIVGEVLEEQRGRIAASAGAGAGAGAGAAAAAAAVAAISDITDEDVASFCRNVHNLRRVETRPYADEWASHGPDSDSANAAPAGSSASADGADADADADAAMSTPLEDDIRSDLLAAAMDPHADAPEHTPLLWHVALRAADSFRDRSGRYPGCVPGGTNDEEATILEADAAEVQSLMERVCRSMGLEGTDLVRSTLLKGGGEGTGSATGTAAPAPAPSAHAAEIVRYGNAELHGVASVVGGVASQEAVKLITGQYVPLDDTYVYNGIAGTAAVYRL